MLTDVYETTTCKGYKIDTIRKQLKVELITRDHITDLIIENERIEGVKLLLSEADHIAPFSHPLIVDGLESPVTIIDVRRLTKVNSENIADYRVQNKPDLDLLILRARLTNISLTIDPQKLLIFDPLPAAIFGRWINNALAFKMGLTMYEQNIIVVLSIAYYIKMFDHTTDVVELGLFINRNTYIDTDIVEGILDKDDMDELLSSLTGFIEALKYKISNVRMDKLSLALLLASLTYGWRGTDAKETMAICLEHPLTWIACLTMSIKDKNFKHSPISKIVKNFTRKDKDKEFIFRLDNFLAVEERGLR